ncbi:MAG: MBL fold metallo-hydrolase [Polyangiaceae bacterium]
MLNLGQDDAEAAPPAKRAKAAAAQRLTYIQYGGFTGSYAGDCGVIFDANEGDVKSTVLMIDCGRENQALRAQARIRRARDLHVIVTHLHADHVNAGVFWGGLQADNVTVYHGGCHGAPARANFAALQRIVAAAHGDLVNIDESQDVPLGSPGATWGSR